MRLDRTRITIVERGLAETLDLSLIVLREFFFPVLGFVLVLAIPFALLNHWATYWMAADLSENVAISRYLFVMSQLVYVEAPLASVLATAFLGKVTFYEEPTLKTLFKEVMSASHRLLWTQGTVRCVLLVLTMIMLIEQDDVVSVQEGFLPFICVGLFVVRSMRPYINEIVLLERSPLRKSKDGQNSIGTRSSRLHSPNSGDLFGRSIILIFVTLIVGTSLLGSVWFLVAIFTNHWGWSPFLNYIAYPAVLWMLVAWISVVRFLSYLDLRIRREGWEIELQMRAEAARLSPRVSVGSA